MTTNGIPSIDKNRLDKNSIDNIYGQDQPKTLETTEDKIWEKQFNLFYDKYPKKVKKQDTKKWFEKNKPSNELFSFILDKLEQFRASKDWQKDGGQYIPYPTTWLNQKRWEDEAIKELGKQGFEQRTYGNLDFLYANQEAKND